MKTYKVIKLSTAWSTSILAERVEKLLNEKEKDGYQIISVAFGVNLWWLPTAFITICK